MSHLSRFYELKAKNDSEPVSFDCLLADFEELKERGYYFKLFAFNGDEEEIGWLYANDFCRLVSESKYYLSFDAATFAAYESQIAIDFDNMEIMIYYGV